MLTKAMFFSDPQFMRKSSAQNSMDSTLLQTNLATTTDHKTAVAIL